MRSGITAGDLRKLASALADHGVPTTYATGGMLYGEIRVKDTPFVVRIYSTGKAHIYNLYEGTLNKPIPIIEWAVEFGRGWVGNLASLIADAVALRRGEPEVCSHHGTPNGSPDPMYGGATTATPGGRPKLQELLTKARERLVRLEGGAK